MEKCKQNSEVRDPCWPRDQRRPLAPGGFEGLRGQEESRVGMFTWGLWVWWCQGQSLEILVSGGHEGVGKIRWINRGSVMRGEAEECGSLKIRWRSAAEAGGPGEASVGSWHMFITHICNICCKAFGCQTHWCLFQFQKITHVVTVGEQGKASSSLPTTLLVSVVGSGMSVGGRQKVHQSWLVVESGKVAQSQVSGLCTLTKYLMFLKELLFLFQLW